MSEFVLTLFCWFRAFFRSRNGLGLEILALRQQVSVLKRKNPRPRLDTLDRVFWVLLRRVWSRWAEMLVVVLGGLALRRVSSRGGDCPQRRQDIPYLRRRGAPPAESEI